MSKIVLMHEFGGPEVLKLEELPTPEPAPGEVRLKVEAIGLNRAEVMYRSGNYPLEPRFPSKNGYEAAGVIDAIGSDVTGFAIGDRVASIPAMFQLNEYGVYGNTAIVPARAVAHYPENLTPEEGASIWMQYLTAYGALVQNSRIGSKDVVLITAASSSVGLAAIQIAKAEGATTIAATRGRSKAQRIAETGAEHVIVSDEEDLAKRVMEITHGMGASVIFDPVAGPFVKTLADAAASHAVIYEYGALAGNEVSIPVLPAMFKALSVRGYTMYEVTTAPENLERGIAYVREKLASGAFRPIIDNRKFRLEEISNAHAYMESNQQFGKIVVTV